MTSYVIRVFSNPAAARAASEDLQRQGFAAGAVRLAGAGEDTAAALQAHGVRPDEAARLAGFGGAVVSVRAEFGEGQTASRVLDAHGPVAAPAPGQAAAPARDTAAPEGGNGSLAAGPAPLSDWLGIPLLSRDPAPLSSRLGLSVLSPSAAPLSHALGLPVLASGVEKPANLPSGQPAVLSTALGLRTLLRDPAPFSALFNWQLLTRTGSPQVPPHGAPAAM